MSNLATAAMERRKNQNPVDDFTGPSRLTQDLPDTRGLKPLSIKTPSSRKAPVRQSKRPLKQHLSGGKQTVNIRMHPETCARMDRLAMELRNLGYSRAATSHSEILTILLENATVEQISACMSIHGEDE